MRSTLLAVFLVLPAVAVAGDPCDKGKIKTDPMSGATSMEFANGGPVGWERSANGYALNGVDLTVSQSTAWFHLSVTYPGIVDMVLPKGTTFNFKLDSGDVLTIRSTDQAVPTGQASQYGVWSSYSFDAGVPKAVAQQFGTHLVTAVSLDAPQGPQAWVVNKGGQKRFQAATACLVTLLK